MDFSVLEELGLSKGEIKVYLALLEQGVSKVGTIIEKTEIASSAVHNSLHTLLNKGLISYIKKGKIRYYQASPPKYLENFFKQKLERLKEILPIIEEKQKIREKQEAEVFEGIKGVTTMLNLLIEDTKKGEEYLFFATYIIGKNKEIQEFFEKYDFRRKEKGLYVRGLALPELKPLFLNRNKILHIKYPKFPIPKDVSIVKDTICLISWGERPIGFLIRSKQIAEMYRSLFNEVWNKT
ncbi:hypothetical protein HYW75_01870 [Candidatus Pacearchaeota archaeon]|nr:hypothetical protein [Candidatus Pacearchaeota archaeon]